MNLQLTDLQQAARTIGRAVVFRADAWDGTSALTLTHLGDTEGDITVAANESYVHATYPELTGPAKHESYVEGEDPVITIPLFVADPDVRAILSPTGNAGGGYSRRRRVKEHTLVLFPEELFYDEATDTFKEITFSDGAWKMGSAPLTTEQTRLLGLSMWFWRGFFTRPPVSFRHTDAGKAVDSVSFQVMQAKISAEKLPEGQRLYTLGDPAEASIDIKPGTGGS